MIPAAEAALTAAIVRQATRFGRYGYRGSTALLRAEGWRVNPKRVEWLWRREGLKVPRRQPKRGWRNHVWASDLMAARTHDGRPLRLLTVSDEYTRKCHAIEVARHVRADDELHGQTHRMMRSWLQRVGSPTLVIEPGSSWGNG